MLASPSRLILMLAAIAVAMMIVPASASAYSTRSNVRYATHGNVALTADIYLPGGKASRPIVVLVHGGGWLRGDKAEVSSSAKDLVNAGFVVANINYRLTCGTNANRRAVLGYSFTRNIALCGGGKTYIPNQVEDVRAAVAFMRRNARRYGGNPNRIALVGSSAGGHLSMMAATNAPAASRVKAVVNWSGPVSSKFIWSQNARRAGSIKGAFTNAVGCFYPACTQQWDAVSPQLLTKRSTPRFSVLNAVSRHEPQVTVGSMSLYHRYVKRLGWRSELLIVNGNCHSRECLTRSVINGGGGTVNNRSIAFLRRVI